MAESQIIMTVRFQDHALLHQNRGHHLPTGGNQGRPPDILGSHQEVEWMLRLHMEHLIQRP